MSRCKHVEMLGIFPAVSVPPTAAKTFLPFFSLDHSVLSLYSHYDSPTCRPPGGPLTWLRRGRCFPPALHLGGRQSGLGTEALGSPWSCTRMLPGLLMLCEDPETEVRQMDGMSSFNWLETHWDIDWHINMQLFCSTCYHETLGTCVLNTGAWGNWAMGYTIHTQPAMVGGKRIF